MSDFMIHVERVVRPIEAMDHHKDRMREELLAHLQASYEQERAKLNDDALAARKAIAGLGDPEQLRTEMQDSVSRRERFQARIEKLFNWRAPEPAWRYTLRSGAFVFALFLPLIPIALLELLAFGQEAMVVALQLTLGMGLLTGVNVFVLGWLYFKARDSMWGAFGAERSWFRLMLYVIASAATVETSLLVFLYSTTGELVGSLSLLLGRVLVALVLPVTGVIVAWVRGPAEIRHALWECLDIREPPQAVAQ